MKYVFFCLLLIVLVGCSSELEIPYQEDDLSENITYVYVATERESIQNGVSLNVKNAIYDEKLIVKFESFSMTPEYDFKINEFSIGDIPGQIIFRGEELESLDYNRLNYFASNNDFTVVFDIEEQERYSLVSKSLNHYEEKIHTHEINRIVYVEPEPVEIVSRSQVDKGPIPNPNNHFTQKGDSVFFNGYQIKLENVYQCGSEAMVQILISNIASEKPLELKQVRISSGGKIRFADNQQYQNKKVHLNEGKQRMVSVPQGIEALYQARFTSTTIDEETQILFVAEAIDEIDNSEEFVVELEVDSELYSISRCSYYAQKGWHSPVES